MPEGGNDVKGSEGLAWSGSFASAGAVGCGCVLIATVTAFAMGLRWSRAVCVRL